MPFPSHKEHCIPVVLEDCRREMCEAILGESIVQSKPITEGSVQKLRFLGIFPIQTLRALTHTIIKRGKNSQI